jgi:formylmethanofuran dehydrogenase subunit E
MIEYLLTAPFEQVFDQTEVRFEAPPDTFKRYKTRKCPHCGEDCREPFLRVLGGEIICLDCAEKK